MIRIPILALALGMAGVGCVTSSRGTDDRDDGPDAVAPADVPADLPDVAPPSDVPADVPADTPADLPTETATARAFAVGSLEQDFEDTTRKTPANGGTAEKPSRLLTTRVWYPAQGDPAAADAVEGAPPDLSGAPYPLILFVHGSSGTRIAYSWFGQGLARAGYVVAAADFPLTSLMTDGGASDWHVEDQPADLSFLASILFAGGPDGLPAMALDEPRGDAVAGHSTGGTVSLLAAFREESRFPHDRRVAAAIDLSGDACFFAPAFFAPDPTVPLLAVGASRDFYVPAPNNVVYTYQNARAPKNLVVLKGGSHLWFTDWDVPDDQGVTPTRPEDPLAATLSPLEGGTVCTPVPSAADDPPLGMEAQHALTVAWARAFLDSVMRGEDAGLDALRKAPEPRIEARWE